MSKSRSPLPSLSQLTNELAQANLQVGGSVEEVFDVVSEQQGAARRSDWPEVQRMAELIVMDGLIYGTSAAEANRSSVERDPAPDIKPAAFPQPAIGLQAEKRRSRPRRRRGS